MNLKAQLAQLRNELFDLCDRRGLQRRMSLGNIRATIAIIGVIDWVLGISNDLPALKELARVEVENEVSRCLRGDHSSPLDEMVEKFGCEFGEPPAEEGGDRD